MSIIAKKIYFIILIFFTYLFVYSQKIEIKWSKEQSINRFQGDLEKFPYFSPENFSLINGIPIFSGQSENSQNYNNVTIENIKWKKINKNELFDVNYFNIPSEEYKISEIKNGIIYYSILTFKKEKGEIFKLESFDLTPTNNNFNRLNKQSNITSFSESILKSGDYYKIRINKSGIYKLDYNFFKSKGINIDQINPKNIKIYGNSGNMLNETIDDFRYPELQENPILVVGQEDGVFNQQDYILFYGKSPDYWKINNNKTVHIKNIYDDFSYYFINFDSSEGKRIPEITSQNASNFFSTYDENLFFEEDLVNLNQVGRLWLGEKLDNQQQNISFNATNINFSKPIITRVSFGSNTAQNIRIQTKLNGNNILNTNIINNNYGVVTNQETLTNINENKLNYQISIDNSANPQAVVHLNFIETIFEKNLIYSGENFSFRKNQNIEDGNLYGFRIQNVNPSINVWNVADISSIHSFKNNSNSDDIFEFSYSSTNQNFKNEFIAFTENQTLNPDWIGKISNQNIKAFKDIDYFIISHNDFIQQANRLANYHKSRGLNTEVILINDIYNEFSSGGQDITAIRDFLRFHHKKDNKKLKYVLFFGDASYDYKNRIPNNTNFIPSFQSINSQDFNDSFVTDDFFTILEDGESKPNFSGETQINSFEMDIAIGRIPATNQTNAKVFVDKILAYVHQLNSKGSSFGDWITKLHLVVDDDGLNLNNNTGIYNSSFHSRMDVSVGNLIKNNLPGYTLNKVYADSFAQQVSAGGQRFPQVNNAIKNAIETGSLLINYFGHGGPLGWAQERILTLDDIRSNQNFNSEFSRFPLLLTITCDFSIWDNPSIEAGGEILLFNPNGGVNATITTSRAIGVQYGLSVNEIFMDELLKIMPNNNFQSIGQAVLNSKKRFFNFDNRKVNLLGDPAISLSRPQQNIELLEINGENAQTFDKTIRALDFVSIKGRILNNDNQIDTSFNQNVLGTLYDKESNKSTLNNDGDLPILNYKEQVNSIFKGSAQVENGNFNLEFYVPKDIDFNVGNSKLTLYSDNKKIDAFQFKDNLKLGGINPDGINDNNPPKVNLYMNNINFVNGGITTKNPFLLACITDDFGINATGNGIGHDITAILDGNVLGTFILNEFYTSGKSNSCNTNNLKDFQQGRVVFPLNNLTIGNHQIVFKIWDINNNSTTSTLDFLVVEEGSDKLIIKNLLNWPNPFTDKTFFHFEHNCPEQLQVNVQIYTISGKLVKTINQYISSVPFREGFRTGKYDIPWDGLDDFKNTLAKGTYIYKINVMPSNQNTCKGSASATEKLVIIK